MYCAGVVACIVAIADFILRPLCTRAGSDLDNLDWIRSRFHMDSILSALVRLLGANYSFTWRSASAF